MRITNPNYIINSFFALFLILGIWLVPDYGISWDEAVQRRHGIVTFDYVNEKLDLGFPKYRPKHELKTYRERHYGILFSTSCFVFEKVLGLEKDFRGRYLMRHYLTFFLFWLGTIFFFKLLKLRLENWKYALLGTLFLILSPRIFANAFYNSKDLILLPCYIIATYTTIRFLNNKKLKYALIHALASAIVINTRIVGILIPVLTIFWLILEWVQNFFHQKKIAKNSPSKSIFPILIYFAVTVFLSISFWPWLWEAPITHFLDSWKAMSKFNWGGKNLFWGEFIPGDQMPWHYIPNWIIITTPIQYLILILISISYIIRNVYNSLKVKSLYQNEFQKMDLILCSLFVTPLLAIIIKESTVYNGWRQLYFIYPSMLALGIIGLFRLFNTMHKRYNIRFFSSQNLLILALISLIPIAFWMSKNHPHQNVYFNVLAGKNKFDKFDLEYWGLSYKQAFEKLSENHPNDTISVRVGNYPGEENHRFLPKKIKNKIILKYGNQDAQFFISNLYGEKDFLKYKTQKPPYDQEVDAIEVDGEKIVRIFRFE